MHTYRSAHYPTTKNAFFLLQERALYYYAVLMMVVILVVVLKMFGGGGSVLWVGLGGVLGAMLLGNVAAVVSLRKTYAEIIFVGEHFSLISVYDILFPQQQRKAFPLRFANPGRTSQQLSFHFNDQIITLDQQDWEDFELIWNDFLNFEAQ